MENLLFTIIAVSAVAAFVLGLIQGFWAILLVSVLLAAVILFLAR